jgi:hypothetical protein
MLGGLAPAVMMALMLRRGAPLSPRLTTALGVLAVAGLGNLGMCLAETHPLRIVVLVWHGGTLLTLALFAAWAGGRLLNWKGLVAVGFETAPR